MARSLAPGLALCLVLAAVAAAVPAPAGSVGGAGHPAPTTGSVTVGAASPPTPTDNTTARLEIPAYRVQSSGFETVELGMGEALAAGVSDVRGHQDRLAVEAEYRNAATVSEKQKVIGQALIRIDGRIRELRARERAAIRNYSEGEISARTLLTRLARIDAEARRLARTLDRLNQFRRDVNAHWFRSRIIALSVLTETLQGPVRSHAADVFAGEAPPTRVFVETSETGVVLAMVDDGTYVREATDLRFRDRSTENNVGSGEARARELYPWAFSDDPGFSIDGALSDGVNTFRVMVPHPQGELVAYLDASNRDIYREVQRLRVDALPAQQVHRASRGDLQVTVRRTYPGGPLTVVARDGATGDPLYATVTVGGERVGTTDDEGALVALAPRPPYEVTVTGAGTTLNVTVERGPGE